MGNILFLHAVGLSPYALDQALPAVGASGDEAPAFEQLTERMFQLPEVDRAVLLTDLSQETIGPCWKNEWGPIVSRSEWTAEVLLHQLQDESDGYEHIFYLWADAPLLDIGLSEKMYRNHCRFFADYTFADGYPRGLTPQIIKPEAVPQFIELSQKHQVQVGRDFLFEVLQNDINAFDLETEVAPVDQRLLRVCLAADTRRNLLLLKRVIRAGGKDAASVQEVLQEQPELLRTLPAYINIQIAGGCPQACSYCPYPRIGGEILKRRDEMPLDKWKELLDQVEEFCDDAVIGISAWGEPALHSQITDIITAVLERPKFSLTVETSGVGWTAPVLKRIAEEVRSRDTAAGSRLSWIVSLDSDEKEMYAKLRGPQLEEALAAVDMLGSLFPGQVYVQAVRMKTNEEELDRFYQRWRKREDLKVIVQKYDSFCGALPERKVTDLSPIERFPCWHLKRDILVLLDGTVPMCREDLEQKYILGNVFEEKLEEVWKRGEEYYLQHLKAEYPPLCRKCDEYYTYNF